MKSILLIILFLNLGLNLVFAADGLVPINGESLPAADLYSPDYGALDSEFAYELKQEGVDLSRLNPVKSNLWNGEDNFKQLNEDLNLPIDNGDTLSFKGLISSPESILRFNATNEKGTFQVHLSKTLHTILLRKNLLRKAGFIIPSSKYMKNLRIEFNSQREKDFFKDVDLVSQLGASYKNWLVEEGDDYLVLKDIFVRLPKEDDFYDVALTSINDTKDLRALRSLIVIYSYLNLNESINKFSFNFLKIKNNNLLFDYPTATNFDATYDDVVWAARFIVKLTRRDIQEIVQTSFFPMPVAKLLVEKLVARRNNLIETLKLEGEILPYVKEVKDELIDKGFLKPHKFEDYASQFSFGASVGPLDDIPSFLFGEAQSFGFKEIMSKLSENLSLFNLSEAKVKWLQEDFEANKEFALEYFDEHGEFPPLPFSSWKSPVAKGNIIFGRDVVVGQNFGTDNFVQLADTIGFTTNLGLFIGLERFGSQLVGGSVFPNIGINTSYSHVRPVEDLKQAIKTPYKNMLVGLTLKNLEKKLSTYIATSKNTEIDESEKLQKLNDLYNSISENIGVGESIIISTSVVPDITLSLSAPLYGVGNGYGSISKKYKELSRIHITRKSKYIFHIYYDGAKVNEVRVRGGLSYLIPIIMAEGSDIKSKLDMKLYELNLDPNGDELEFASDVAKFISLLRDRTNEAMGEEDIQVFNKSHDKAFNFNFLFFVSKSLKTITELFVKVKDQVNLKLVTASHGEMDGINLAKLMQNLGAYALKQFVAELDVNWDKSYIPMVPEAKHYYQNPGKSFFGSATTYETTIESKLRNPEGEIVLDNMNELYMHFRKTHQKAVMKEKTIKKYLRKENKAFNLDLYTDADSKDAGAINFAKLETKIHFFDKAVKRIFNISGRELDFISSRMKKRNCHNRENGGQTISGQLRCGDLEPIENKLYWCKKYIKKERYHKGLKCLAHVGHYFARYIDAKTLLEFFGEENIYVESQLSGYRIKSELMLKPIIGNSYGKVNTRNFGGPVNKMVSVLNLIKAEVMGYWYRGTLK